VCLSLSLFSITRIYIFICLSAPRISIDVGFSFFLARALENGSSSYFFVDDTYDFNSCVALHLRIANHMVMDSYCRGGIVNTRFGCSSALVVRPQSSKALWRFRVSTSNSPSGRSWPPTDTKPMR